jgi:uncharacterized membrane protein
MRLLFKIIFVTGIFTFVVLQFFQPEKNTSQDVKNHIFTQEQIPENVKEILKTSCMDCHSNNTVYLWYDRISPVSWLVNNHIKDGKKELNFSQWGELDKFKKISKLEDIREELEQKTMPLKQYTALHWDAKLTEEEIAVLTAWIDKTGEELLKSSIEK